MCTMQLSHVFCVLAGSIIVTLTVSGTVSGVNNTLTAMCNDISNGTSFTLSGQSVTMSTYMTYNGNTYYGVQCAYTVSL